MKKFKFIAFIFAIMTTMPILQSCLDLRYKAVKSSGCQYHQYD